MCVINNINGQIHSTFTNSVVLLIAQLRTGHAKKRPKVQEERIKFGSIV
jgi:hypothetical protein